MGDPLVVVTNVADPQGWRNSPDERHVAALSVEQAVAPGGAEVLGTWSLLRLRIPSREAPTVALSSPLDANFLCVHPTRLDQRVDLLTSLITELIEIWDSQDLLAGHQLERTLNVMANSSVPVSLDITPWTVTNWELGGVTKAREHWASRTTPPCRVVDVTRDLPPTPPSLTWRCAPGSLLEASVAGDQTAQTQLTRLTLRNSLATALHALHGPAAATLQTHHLDDMASDLQRTGQQTLRHPSCTHVRAWPETAQPADAGSSPASTSARPPSRRNPQLGQGRLLQVSDADATRAAAPPGHRSPPP